MSKNLLAKQDGVRGARFPDAFAKEPGHFIISRSSGEGDDEVKRLPDFGFHMLPHGRMMFEVAFIAEG